MDNETIENQLRGLDYIKRINKKLYKNRNNIYADRLLL